MNRRMEKLIPDDEHGNEPDDRGQPEQEQDMQSCPQDVLWDFAAMVAPKVGAMVTTRKSPHLSGNSVDGGGSRAEIIEWTLPGGEVVARKVTALGQTERWLRADLATDTLIARSDAFAAKESLIKEMADYSRATRRHPEQRKETYVLSSALIHAASRRQATLGGLYDMDARGDKIRGNLVAALGRAVKAGGAK